MGYIETECGRVRRIRRGVFNSNMGYIETRIPFPARNTPTRLIVIWDILKPASSMSAFLLVRRLIVIWDILKRPRVASPSAWIAFNSNMGYIETDVGQFIPPLVDSLIVIWDILKLASSFYCITSALGLIVIWDILKQAWQEGGASQKDV